MRRTGNIRSPFGNHTRRIDVGVVSEPTVPASKRLTVPLSGLDMPATRTGCASVGRAYHLDSNAVNRRKQEYSFPEESGRVLLPANQAFRVFKCNASSRTLCHGHNAAGLTGQHLPLGTHVPRLIPTVLLQHGATVARSFQDRPEIGAAITVRPRDGRTRPDIAADPFGDGLFVGQRDFHPNPAVPFAILPEHFALLAEGRSRQSKRSVNRTMLPGGNVQFAHALDHDPHVKALGFPGSLDMGRVNQLSTKCSRLMSSFSGASPIRERTPVRSARKLAQALGAGASALLTQRRCAGGMMSRKEGRQER
jgi:hypothetical protein